MNVVLLGASGMIGSRILNELISRGHQVTAVVRDPTKVEAHENVTATAGDIFNPDSVADAARGGDVVVSAYGPGPENPDVLLNATRGLIAGVAKSGVKRLVAVGGAGSLEVAPGVRLVDTPAFPPEWRSIALRHRDALDLLRASTLDWTSISPAAYIHPGDRTGTYRLGKDQLVVNDRGESEISAEDFAIAVADEVENPRHSRERFTAGW
ncbi:MAG TPA: NAD(P)-dependent oxidoreductase [Bryobacteraceae bacterium]|nr:NAD(P)-dependent oxidoreductase [Bryobacteraceae bacterium]